MEEILASIRRIIADDEAKPPPGADKPAAAAPPPAAPAKPEKSAPEASAPAAKPPVVNDVAPSKAAPPPAAAKPAAPPPPPPPAASNNQDDIDALLNGLDETTTEEEVRSPQGDGEVMDLTDEMAVEVAPPPSPQNAFHKIDPEDDLEFAESTASKSMQRPPAEAAAQPRPTPMLSTTTVSAVESAFNTLAHTVLSNNARTLEDLVKEMLRPMLKSWLDDNLPGLVERIVKAEIERVSRGR